MPIEFYDDKSDVPLNLTDDEVVLLQEVMEQYRDDVFLQHNESFGTDTYNITTPVIVFGYVLAKTGSEKMSFFGTTFAKEFLLSGRSVATLSEEHATKDEKHAQDIR